MKQIYILTCIFIFSCINSMAQTTDVVITGLDNAFGLAINGNYLYIAENNGNKISKIDLNDDSPTLTKTDVVITGLDGPFALAFNGNDLYIAEFNGNKISRITDVNSGDSFPRTPEDVVTGVNFPTALAINGNDLYIVEYLADKISKIDLAADDPSETLTDVVTISYPFGLAFNGNDLYISESAGDDKISKIDITDDIPITPTDVVTGLSTPLGLAFNGNDLYIAEFNDNKISKIDITDDIPITPTDVVTGLSTPLGLAFNRNDLYISDGTKISKFTVPTLSTNDYPDEVSIKLYPNPSSDFIQSSGLSKPENFTMYSIRGTEVKKGVIFDNEKVDIQNLTSGIYFMKFDNGNTLKFIKE